MLLDTHAAEHEIITAATVHARRVYSMLQGIGRTVAAPTTAQELRARLDAMAERGQAAPVADDVALAGRIARMCDPRWWSRRMRRRLLRESDNKARHAGRVRAKRDVYLSDFALKRTIARHKANADTLERMEAVNEEGFAITLADAAKRSISEPKLRRGELMTRCRGFEEIARLMGHRAVFLTITCPSRFHRFSDGRDNPRWTGQTARDGQEYLCKLWAGMRAAWRRQGIVPYGFRVVEPHHDGAPHWHILLFVHADHVGWFDADRFVAGHKAHGAGLVGIAGRYALRDTPTERGARLHRFTCKHINDEVITDARTGAKEFNRARTATGYIAKYIAKNIDGLKEGGEGVGLDFASGKRADIAAARVRAWAGVHGIRQFQQIGGPSVTVYRELRRLDPGQPLQMDLFEQPRAAADSGSYAHFWMVQGGPEVPRAEQLRPLYGYQGQGRYGDEVDAIVGVQDGAGTRAMRTRVHEWTVQARGTAARDFECQEQRDALERARHIAAFLDAAGMEGLPVFSGSEATAWTGVNNCTAEVAAAFDEEENEAAAAEIADYWRSRGVDVYAQPAPEGIRQLQ